MIFWIVGNQKSFGQNQENFSGRQQFQMKAETYWKATGIAVRNQKKVFRPKEG